MMRIGFIFLIFVFCQCTLNYDVREIDGIDLSELKGDSTSVLRFDGLYSLYDTPMGFTGIHGYELFVVSNPLLFINQNEAIWSNYISYTDDRTLYLSNYESYIRLVERVGDYVVRNDTILAKLPITLYHSGNRRVIYEAYFQGIIQNSDNIIDWHIIPPYPKVNMKFNNDLHFLKTPRILTFIESEELLGLDSLVQKRLLQEE